MLLCPFEEANLSIKTFQRYANFVIVYTIMVILWGAFVRASGSGAGCGDHWPLCNGELVPTAPMITTLIEFGHRLTSGLSLLLVVGLVFFGFKLFEKGHAVRKAVVLSLVFILLEAALGAGLVIFELVDKNDSIERAVVVCLHLLNTLGLLGALSWTSFTSKLEGYDLSLNFVPNKISFYQIVMLFSFSLVVMAGGIVALGDTLFPATSLIEGIKADFNENSHFLIRLRAIHPILAIISAFGTIYLVDEIRDKVVHPKIERIGKWLTFAVLFQVAFGALNVFLLAPVWMQLGHLAIADVIWLLMTGLLFETNLVMIYDETGLSSFLGEAQLAD
jgi:heme a synthase